MKTVLPDSTPQKRACRVRKCQQPTLIRALKALTLTFVHSILERQVYTRGVVLRYAYKTALVNGGLPKHDGLAGLEVC